MQITQTEKEKSYDNHLSIYRKKNVFDKIQYSFMIKMMMKKKRKREKEQGGGEGEEEKKGKEKGNGRRRRKRRNSAIKLSVQFEGWDNLHLLIPRPSTDPGIKKSSVNISERMND